MKLEITVEFWVAIGEAVEKSCVMAGAMVVARLRKRQGTKRFL